MILSIMMKVFGGDTTPFPTSERINSKSFRVYLEEGGGPADVASILITRICVITPAVSILNSPSRV